MRTQDAGTRLRVALAGIALAIVALAASVPATSDASPHQPLLRSSCDTGWACFWSLDDYAGDQVSHDVSPGCCEWRDVYDGETWHSAKNRMTNRRLQLGAASAVVACLDPGENRPDPGGFDRFRIGASGSSCP